MKKAKFKKISQIMLAYILILIIAGTISFLVLPPVLEVTSSL